MNRRWTRTLSQLLVVAIGISLLAGCTSKTGQPNPIANPAEPGLTAPSPTPIAVVVTPTPTSTPAVSPSPSPVVGEGAETGKPVEEPALQDARKKSTLQPIYSVDKGSVAITIDDGPTKYTKDLLKVLRENGNTKVTFFFLGQNASAYPSAVTEAVYDGNEVGYHSDVHPKMTDMTYDQQEAEFDRGLAKLTKLDHDPVTLFRPPYGAYNNDTKLITEAHHMKMVLWNEDPRDWATTDTSTVVKSVLDQVHSGSVIVMHDHPSTIAALPAIIEGIKKKGYKLVTI